MRILGSILVLVGGATVLYLAIRGARYWDWRQRIVHNEDHMSPAWLHRVREEGY